MAQRFFTPNEQFYDGAGNPMAGGQLFFFASGTSTPQNTFNDSGLTIANPNPVVLDSAGRAGSIFLGSNAYKVVLQDSLGNLIWTFDPVASPASSPIFLGGVTTGSANSQVVAGTSPSGYSRSAGNIIIFKAAFTNTTGMTLNVSGTGAVNLMKPGATGPVALTGGEVISGGEIPVIDDGTQYVLFGVPPAGAITWSGPQTFNASALFTGQTSSPEITLPATTGTVTLDLSTGNNFGGTLTGNITLANPSNPLSGQSGAIRLAQDTTGSRIVTYGTSWKFQGGIKPPLSTAANAIDIITYYVINPTTIAANLVGSLS